MSVGPEGVEELPFGLRRERHVNQRDYTPWTRRLALALMLAFCILALLDTFGQAARSVTTDSPAASLSVDSPDRLRGGLIFTSVITVVAHQKLQDARLVLSPGWFNGMTLNAQAPQSNQQSSDAGGASFDYGPLDAGTAMPVWISWQANPTTAGPRDQDVVVMDGDRTVVALHRRVVVFP